MSLKITNVKVNLVKNGTGKTRGYASITFNDVMTCHGWKIISGPKGLFAAPPSHSDIKDKTKWFDDITFIDTEQKESMGSRAKKYVQDAVLKAYTDKEGPGTEQFNQAKAADEEAPF